MCGITGWASTTANVDENILSRMTDRLAHRGPDGRGTWISTGHDAGLGHRRLAVIDLSDNARQPLPNEDASVWMVYNGEIYNFTSIREELEAAGHIFRSRTDSEVIVHGYEEWGIERLLRKISGMFAFAIWDTRRNELITARDRLGIKPIYISHLPGGDLVFSSEAKALLEHPGIGRRISREGLLAYLSYGYCPHETGIFRGVKKLQPGHYLTWQDGHCTEKRWWELEYAPSTPPESFSDASVHLLERLHEAVRSHMVADVPVGSFLSGGVDSSTVTALAVQESSRSYDTFCVGFHDDRQEDVTYARLVSETIKTMHHELVMTSQQAQELLQKFPAVMDEPLYDPSAMAMYILAHFARKHVVVALSGTGGDEIFAGYGWLLSQMNYARKRRMMGPLAFALGPLYKAILPALRPLPLLTRLSGATKLLGRTQAERSFYLRGFLDAWEQKQLLRGDYAAAVGPGSHLWMYERTQRPEWPLAPALMYHDIKTYLADNCLVLLDRTTMAHGLESRVPLLDHSLVEWVFSLPWEYQLSGDDTKHLMKEAIRPVVPVEVITRSKAGFSPPFKKWLRKGEMGNLIRDLKGSSLVRDGILDGSFVERILSGRALRRWHKLWLLLTLEAWYKYWITQETRISDAPSSTIALCSNKCSFPDVLWVEDL